MEHRSPATVQRRVSRLYTDTKKSSDFVNIGVRDTAWQLAHDDPDIKALHRKLRIQKDRLVAWGLEWSEPGPSPSPDEIDDALARAGLSEIVGSVMTTIKDILAEAEQRWITLRRARGSERRSEKSSSGLAVQIPDVKSGMLSWDKGRFEDLVRDLATSIDTLYDFSRTRWTAAAGRNAFQARGKVADERASAFETSRLQTPQQIDPVALSPMHEIRSAAGRQANSLLREIVIMRPSVPPLSEQRQRGIITPLLLEYAPFDSIYATTGIMPPMARFEKLSTALQQETQRGLDTWSGLPALAGYLEDFEHSRLGLVYHFPPGFNVMSSDHTTQSTAYGLHTLRDLLTRRNFEPHLEAKFRLAHNLANTLFDLHSRAAAHGNLRDTTVSFGSIASTMEPGMLEAEIDIRRPMVSSFEIFTDNESDEESSTTNPDAHLYRHPLDPRTTPSSPLTADKIDGRIMDLYSLAMLLLQIGLWTLLDNLVPSPCQPIPESMLEQLAVRCGSPYTKAVKVCWAAVDEELAGKTTGDALLYNIQSKVSRYLEACCILDGVTRLEETLGHDLSSVSTAVQSPPIAGPVSSKVTFSESEPVTAVPPTALASAKHTHQPAKLKSLIFHNIPLPAETVRLWNTVTMGRVNSALRSFYRKHATESVEVSLAAVGPSAQQTVATVIVVCTSVAQVRSILRKKLADLFDSASPTLGLKVCRGEMVRSRKPAGLEGASKGKAEAEDKQTSSTSDLEEVVVPVNSTYQPVLRNGASIGAWIGTRHLPPVSLGGLIVVDGKTYGMTVHHMLDDPDAPPSPSPAAAKRGAYHSSAWQCPSIDQVPVQDRDDDDVSGATVCGVDLSDSDSEAYSDTSITSDYASESDGSDDKFDEPGDIVGIEPGCGDGYIITQPAMDDVEEGFYPSKETADEDHIDTFSVGQVFASSGIRRRQQDGLIHEIDWALFEFTDKDRLPATNAFALVSSNGTQPRRHESSTLTTLATISPIASFPGLSVQCAGRTSGLQTGTILPALSSVKIHGRVSPSHSFQVSSTPSSALAIGLPGDSGAWLVAVSTGAVCGHVLAWSSRKRVAYMCPMEVLLQDMADTLCAREIQLPGGAVVVKGRGGKSFRRSVFVGVDIASLDIGTGTNGSLVRESVEEVSSGRDGKCAVAGDVAGAGTDAGVKIKRPPPVPPPRRTGYRKRVPEPDGTLAQR